MSYLKTMYPETNTSSYPEKLCRHLIDKFILEDKRALHFLEVGCGKGTHLKIFSNLLSGKFYGVDFEKIDNLEGCTVKQCNLELEPLPFEDDEFDVVFSKSVIEHVVNTENFLYEIKRVLKPGGKLILMAPDWQSQMKCFYDDPTHVKPFTKQSMFASLKLAKFEKIHVSDFMQLPSTWKYPVLRHVYKFFGYLFPENFKWKSSKGRNTNDRKFIRFSKENMILAFCNKEASNENA